MSNQYILFCAQEANFQTRSMLIPYNDIMKSPKRVADLQILRDNCEKNVIISNIFNGSTEEQSSEYSSYSDGEEYVVDQLLTQNIIWNGKLGSPEITPCTDIIGEFTRYADGSEDYLFHEEDKVWISGIKRRVASKGFDHVMNYCKFRYKTKYRHKLIDIVEGFLILQMSEYDNL